MKKTIAFCFAISAFLGIGYCAWAFSGIGKRALRFWLLGKWETIATRQQSAFNRELFAIQLDKLSYHQHEILTRITLFDPFARNYSGRSGYPNRKRLEKLMASLTSSGAAQAANLHILEDIILPS